MHFFTVHCQHPFPTITYSYPLQKESFFFIAWKALLASWGLVWEKSTDDVWWLKCFHWAKVFLSVCSWHIFTHPVPFVVLHLKTDKFKLFPELVFRVVLSKDSHSEIKYVMWSCILNRNTSSTEKHQMVLKEGDCIDKPFRLIWEIAQVSFPCDCSCCHRSPHASTGCSCQFFDFSI